MKTNDIAITDLLKAVDSGSAQLPDFQRSWVWDDERIKALIASVVHNYPVGAAMFLAYGNESVRFKYRPIEGSSAEGKDIIPSDLILDGQQRLTSLYSALFSQNPVKTCRKTETSLIFKGFSNNTKKYKKMGLLFKSRHSDQQRVRYICIGLFVFSGRT